MPRGWGTENRVLAWYPARTNTTGCDKSCNSMDSHIYPMTALTDEQCPRFYTLPDFDPTRRTMRDRVSALFITLTQNRAIWDPPGTSRLVQLRDGARIYRPRDFPAEQCARNPYSYVYYAKGMICCSQSGVLQLIIKSCTEIFHDLQENINPQ